LYRLRENSWKLQALSQQTQLLDRLVRIVEARQPAPAYLRGIDEFEQFDWSEIDAAVTQTDADGVAIVTWRGHQYVRRSPSNKFSPAIWFSRAVGKDDSGENRYERLITFKELAEPEPLPNRVRRVTRF
jgi:DdrB-like protein